MKRAADLNLDHIHHQTDDLATWLADWVAERASRSEILILGAGAVGGYWARACIRLASTSPSCCARSVPRQYGAADWW